MDFEWNEEWGPQCYLCGVEVSSVQCEICREEVCSRCEDVSYGVPACKVCEPDPASFYEEGEIYVNEESF